MQQGTRQRRFLIHAGAVALAIVASSPLSACGEGSAADTALEQTVEQPIEQVQQGIESIESAGTQACGLERATLEAAIETYAALTGGSPTEVQLVPDYLREESGLFDLSADGTLTPAPGSVCT